MSTELAAQQGIHKHEVTHTHAKPKKVDFKWIDALAEKYDCDQKSVLSILLETQAEYTYLPKGAMGRLSRKLEIPIADLYKIASAYKEFRFKPSTKHRIKVCRCAVCYVKGADKVLDSIKRTLGIRPGETTEDGEYTWEVVENLGLPSTGPVVKVDDKIYTDMTPKKTMDLLTEKEVIFIVQHI